jgi:uncharacterized membrane protein
MQSKHDRNVGKNERWASLMVGGLLAGLGIAKRSWAGAGLAAAGGALIWRGATRHCAVKTALEGHGSTRLERSFTVSHKSPEEVYTFWRNLANLPRVFESLQSVRETSDRRSHWVMKGPAGVPIEWDAEITNDDGGRLIEWRSTPGSTLQISGIVRFKRKHSRGTKVHVTIQYKTPGGIIGEALANLLRQRPDKKVDAGLRTLQETLAHS